MQHGLAMHGDDMNTKPFLVAMGVAFGLVILGSIAGGILQSAFKLTTDQIDPVWVRVVKLAYLALLGVIGFSLVPVLLNWFVAMQIRIGNGELALIKWLSAHQWQVIYAFWGLYAVGLAIAIPAAIRGGFLK
jgi:hypothetical protein